MDIDYSPRASGKTTRLIGWLLQDPDNRTIVCFNAAEADRVFAIVRSMYPDVPSESVVALSSLSKYAVEHKDRVYSFDNLEYMLEKILKVKIDHVTISSGYPIIN